MRNAEFYEKAQNLRDSSNEQVRLILESLVGCCFINHDELPSEIIFEDISIADNQIDTVFKLLTELNYFGPNRPAENYEAFFKQGNYKSINGILTYCGLLVIRPKRNQ